MSELRALTFSQEEAQAFVDNLNNYRVMQWNDLFYLHFCYLCLPNDDGPVFIVRVPIVSAHKEVKNDKKELSTPQVEIPKWQLEEEIEKVAEKFNGARDDLIDELETKVLKIKANKMKKHLGMQQIDKEYIRLEDFNKIFEENKSYNLLDISDSLSSRLGFINIDLAKAFIVRSDDMINIGLTLNEHREEMKDREVEIKND